MGRTAKSFRLDDALAEQMDRAARVEGVPVSEFVRDAIRERCQQVLGRSLREDLADVIGVVDGPPVDIASQTGEAFKALLASRRRP